MTIRPEADAMIAFLNELLAIDRSFVAELVAHRLLCNEALANHPTVQVGAWKDRHHAGFLGVVNGYLGTIDEGAKKGWGPITAVFDGADLIEFRRTEAGE